MDNPVFFKGKRLFVFALTIVLALGGWSVMLLGVNTPASGSSTIGSITVNTGSTRVIEGQNYLLDGDILVNGGTLLIRNSTITLSQDVGMDGMIGGGDDHIYDIIVQSGGTLEFHNSVLTTQTGQLKPYFAIDITVTGAASKMIFEDSILEGPGNLTVADNGYLEVDGSAFVELQDKTKLAYDIDGDGSTTDDMDLNDDGIVLEFLSGGKGIIIDSEIRDSQSFSGSSLDGMQAANITVKGTGTAPSNLTVINSFLYVDLESNITTGTRNSVKVMDGGEAHLVGVTINDTSVVSDPAFLVMDSSSWIKYYRWIGVHVTDGMNMDVGSTAITLKKVEGNTNTPMASLYLTAEMIEYMGRTPSTWATTDGSGWAFLPVATDIFTYSSMPNSDATPDFSVELTLASEEITRSTSLPSYPTLPFKGDEKDLFQRIMDGEAVATSILSDLNGPLTFNAYIHPPGSVSVFDTLDVDLTVNSAMTLTGTTAVIDGTVYPSYYGFDGHLVVGSGGHLTINDTAVRFLTDDGPVYILIENGGILDMNNVTLGEMGAGGLYLYLLGTGTPQLNMDGGEIDVMSTVARGGAVIDIVGESFRTSMNIHGSSVDVAVSADTIFIQDLYARECDLALGGGGVGIMDIDWDGVSFTSANARFNRTLDLYDDSDFLNVTFNGTLPTGRNHWLKAMEQAIVEVSWYVDCLVTDSVSNPLPGAAIDVTRVNPSIPYSNSFTTDEDAKVSIPLAQMLITASGKTFLGNYMMVGSYMGYTSSSSSATLGGSSSSMVLSIMGGPDLVASLITSEGSLITGNHVKLQANITNEGIFDAGEFIVDFQVNGELIGEAAVDGLAAGGYVELTFDWIALEGEALFDLTVDTLDQVIEVDEENNLLSMMNYIGMGPDFTMDIQVNKTEWVYLSPSDIYLFIENIGEDDPDMNPFHVNITWHTDDDVGIVASYVAFDYIAGQGGWAEAYVEWTPTVVGDVTLIAQVISIYDYVPVNSMDTQDILIRTLPDLMVVPGSVEVLPYTPVTVNGRSRIEFDVMNYGELPAGQFQITLYHDEVVEENRSSIDILVDGLEPEAFIHIVIGWDADLSLGSHDLILIIDSLDNVNEQYEDNNKFIQEVMVDLEPDLAIEAEIGVWPNQITDGGNTTIWVVVSNIGNTTAQNVEVRIAMDSDANVIRALMIDLLPGQTYNATIFWDAVGPGDHTLYAIVDPDNSIVEKDETNNLMYKEILVLTKPDVGLSEDDLLITPGSPIPLQSTVSLQATIWNYGQTMARNVKVRFYDGDPVDGGRIINWKDTEPSIVIDEIEGGSWAEVSIEWIAGTGGYHQIYVTIDPTGLIDEGDEENNILYTEVYVKTLPDIHISSFQVYQGDFLVTSSGVGNTVILNATIMNLGDMPSQGFAISFYDGDDIRFPEITRRIGLENRYPADHLLGGSTIYIEMPWTVLYPKGVRDLFVNVITTDGAEQRDDNNRLSTKLEVFDIEDVPELEVQEDSVSLMSSYNAVMVEDGGVAFMGMNISIEFNITNDGGKAASNTTVTLLASNSTDSWIEMNTSIGFIEGSGISVIRGYWNLRSIGMNTLQIIVDPDNDIREFNEGNNIIEVTLEVLLAPDISIRLDPTSDGYDMENGEFNMIKGKEHQVTFIITNSANYTFDGLDITFADGLQTISLTPYEVQEVTFTYKPLDTVNTYESGLVNAYGWFYEEDMSNNDVTVYLSISEEEEEFPVALVVVIVILVLILAGAGVMGYLYYQKTKKEQMAKCSNCSGLVEIEAEFCPHCGIEFSDEIECECGSVIPPDATECPECGRPVKVDLLKLQEEGEEEEEGQEVEEGGEESEDEFEIEVEEELEELKGTQAPKIQKDTEEPVKEAAVEVSEEEMAECFECSAVIPISAPICPHCGAVFE